MPRFVLFLFILLFAALPLGAQTRIITGKVTDSTSSEPVTSGQVSVMGSTTGTTIKDDGTFTISAPTRDVVLMFRSIGFKRRDVAVPAAESALTVTLSRDYFQLEAIVVTGQATGVERKNLANAVGTVNAQQLSAVPAQSIEHALTGKLAGATITTTSGAPGGGAVVNLRGVTSIIGKFTPLYVVDGVIVSDASVAPGTNLLSRSFGNGLAIAGIQDNPVNRIADLNPDDVENVEVLQGASASAIYGSKASNGVIIVTTKRGRVGAPQFTLQQQFGVAAASKLPGTRQFKSAADAVAVFGPTAATYCCTNFDNQGAAYGNKPLSHQTDASVSGGTETTRYFASALLKHDGGIMGHTFADKQSLRLNVDQQVGRRITLSVGSEVIHTLSDRGLTNNENNSSSVMAGLVYGPDFFDMRRPCDKKGDPLFGQCDGPGGIFPKDPFVASNPLQTLELLKNREGVWRNLTTARAQWDVISGTQHQLRLLANGGGDIFTQENTVFAPPDLYFEQVAGLPGLSAQSFTLNQNFNVNSNAVYTFKSSGVSSTTQAGIQYEAQTLNTSRALTQNLIGGLQNINNGTANTLDQHRERVRDFGMFAQEEFLTMNERLLLTVGGRADQSSNNADPKKLYFFPKASASFRAITGGRSLMNEFKLRAAMGFSGNQPLYGQKFTELAAGNVNGVPTFSLPVYPNSHISATDLRPEREREIEAGFDATMLNSRATLEVTAYDKKITDLLLTRALLRTSGYDDEIFNGGSIRSRGLEVGLTAYPVRTGPFQWSTRGTFSKTGCKILSLPVPAFRPNTFLNSDGFGSTYLYPDSSCTRIQGFDTLSDGSTVVNTIGDATPRYKLSWSNDFSFKGLKLYLLWDHQQGGALADLTLFEQDVSQTAPDQDTPKKAGELTGNERVALFGRTARPWMFYDTYTKLREATLSIDLPQKLVQGFWSGARYVRLTLSGRNLVTITKYPTGDPEVVQEARAAPSEVPWDIWSYPPSRSFWFGVGVGF